jgi:hypothetical protein
VATQNLAQQPLSETHLAALTSESGLSPATIEARGYRTVSGPEGAAELAGLGFSVAQANTATRGDVLLVPLYDVIGQCVGHQIRPDVPRVSKGSPLKYETPANGVNHVDIPPAGRERVLDGVSPLWVTEGAKTADALAQAGAGVLMLPGVWGFMGKAARGIGTSVLADLLAVPVMGRTVYLAYDSDVVTKESVQAAERRLAEIMGSRGGLVVAVRIPPGPNGAKQGADDYLARGGSLSELVETAQTTQTAGDPMAGKPPQLWAYELAGEGHEIALDIGGEFLLRPIDAAGRCAGPARRYSRDALRDRIVSMAGFRGVVALPMAAANHAVARLSGDHVDEVVTTATSHIVKNGKATWVDMGTVAGWDVIRIGPEGWGYAPWAEVPVWILRDATSKQLTPPAPVGARSWQPLYDVLGLDLDAFAVVRAWLVGLLVADRVPLLWWRGAQGSGKSTRADLVSRVLGLPGLTAAPQNVQDASSKLRASPWLMVENLGKLDPVISDMWCVAVTEGELSERMLYTSRQTRVADRWTGQITSITDVSGALDDLSSRAMVVDAPLVLRHQSATELRGRLADGIAAVRGALFDDAAAVLARVGAGDVSGAEYRFPTMLAAARVLDDLPPAIEVDGASGHHAIAVMNAARSIVSERGENDPWVEWLADEVVRRGGQWRTYAKEILEAQRAFRARMPLYVYDNEIWPGSAHQIGRWLPTRAGRLLERGVVWRKPPREPDGQPHVFFRVVGSEPETPDSTQTLQGQNPRSDTVSVVTVLSVDPLEVHKKNHEEVIKGDGENAIKSDGGVRGERKPPAKTPESTDTPSDLGVSHVVSNVIANVPYSGADPETTSGLASPTGVYEIGRVT